MYNEEEYINIEQDKNKLKNIFKKEKCYFVDDGINEFIIRKKDIPDYIVIRNTDLKIYDMSGNMVIKTFGMFLDYSKPEIRKDIISNLIQLQVFDKLPNKVTLYTEDIFEELKFENEMELENE